MSGLTVSDEQRKEMLSMIETLWLKRNPSQRFNQFMFNLEREFASYKKNEISKRNRVFYQMSHLGDDKGHVYVAHQVPDLFDTSEQDFYSYLKDRIG